MTGRFATSAVGTGSPRRSITASARRSSRPARKPWPAGRSAPASVSCVARSASSSGLSVARPTSWRSREKHCGRGSEQARRSRLGAGRRGRGPGGGGAGAADQPAGPLPEAEAAACAPAASGDRSGRRRDRRDGEELPDRRLPGDLLLRPPPARRQGEPRAGAQGDARAEADPASPGRGAPASSRRLSGSSVRAGSGTST